MAAAPSMYTASTLPQANSGTLSPSAMPNTSTASSPVAVASWVKLVPLGTFHWLPVVV